MTALIFLVSFAIGIYIAFTDQLFLAGILFENTVELGWAGIWNVRSISRWINALAYACAVALALVTAAILYGDSPNDTGKQKKDRLSILAAKRDDLKVVLYMATISLIVGLLRFDQSFSWATSFIDQAAVVAPVTDFFRSVTTALGGFFTLLTAGVYIPSALIVYEQARTLIAEHEPDDLPAELEKKGFTFSFSDAIPRVLAIAAPLLTGPVAELLKNL
jgi:hypothetical protein